MKTLLSFGLSALGAVILLPLSSPLTCLAGGAPTPDTIATQDGALKIFPINHATLGLQWKDRTIYVDPVGGAKTFQDILTATVQKQVAGSWRKGRMQGNWWLQAAY